MTNAYKKIEGEKENLLIFSDETLSTLEDTNLDIDINVSVYLSENYISDYINNIFDNITIVLENSKYLIKSAKEYIDSSINSIPTIITYPEPLNVDLEVMKEVTVNLKDNDRRLILRTDKNKESKILGTLGNNTRLTVIESDDSNWVKVKTSDGITGYVSNDYIKVEK